MVTRHAARAMCRLRMGNREGNPIPEDSIVIFDNLEEPPVVAVEEEVGGSVSTNPKEPQPVSPKELEKRVTTASNSGRVIFIPPWFTCGGLDPKQLKISFPTKIDGLNHLSSDIRVVDTEQEMLKAIFHLLGHASLDELVVLLGYLEEEKKNLATFGVPDAKSFEAKEGKLAPLSNGDFRVRGSGLTRN
ncbi:hypothetical protein AMTRI_Chr12g236090 [Amborella trichopoda]